MDIEVRPGKRIRAGSYRIRFPVNRLNDDPIPFNIEVFVNDVDLYRGCRLLLSR